MLQPKLQIPQTKPRIFCFIIIFIIIVFVCGDGFAVGFLSLNSLSLTISLSI